VVEDVGILGTGRMAQALAQAWSAVGTRVTLGSRDPQTARRRWSAASPAVLGGHADAALRPVVVLATPFQATAELVARHAEALAGKVVLDITNPFGAAPPGVAGVAVHAAALGRPARWVAAFKTNFWTTVGARDGVERPCFLAADDAEAKGVAAELARAAGFLPEDVGGLDHALALDWMVPLMIALDARHGASHRSYWRFVPGTQV
jgi:predicted dinucleotide-binding enzyme